VTPKDYLEDTLCRKIYTEVSKMCEVEMFKVSLVQMMIEINDFLHLLKIIGVAKLCE